MAHKKSMEINRKNGLNRMNRSAIHFSIGYNNENHVKSGMRLNCEVFIEINTQMAFLMDLNFSILIYKISLLVLKNSMESRELLIAYIQFNYSKKFNLNAVITHLRKIQRLMNSIVQDFIIFSNEQNIKRIKNKFGDEGNAEQKIDAMAQKYQRLKFLIENIYMANFGEYLKECCWWFGRDGIVWLRREIE